MSVLDILKSIGEKIGENINSMIQTIKNSEFIQFITHDSGERMNFFIYSFAFVLLIIFTVLATIFYHPLPKDITGVLKNTSIVGGLLYLLASTLK